jgi:hypothetical protein
MVVRPFEVLHGNLRSCYFLYRLEMKTARRQSINTNAATED